MGKRHGKRRSPEPIVGAKKAMRRDRAIEACRQAIITLALMSVSVGPLTAQDISQPLRYRVGLAPRLGLVSDFGDGSDGGFGLEGTGGIRLGASPVWIRADAGFLDLSETLRTSGVGTSGNTLLSLVAGPEFQSSRGLVRPFFHFVVGYIRNRPGGDASPAEENGTAAWGFGGGARIRLSSTSRPAMIEAGLRITHTGELTFALGEDSDTTDVTIYELRLGLLLGLP